MSELKTDKVIPTPGGTTTLGDSGDTFTIPSGATFTTTDSTLSLDTATATTQISTNKISPATGTGVAVGDSGDTITIPAGVTLANSGTTSGFGGGWTLLSTVTISTGTAAADFSSTYITDTYDEYKIIVLNAFGDTNGNSFCFQLSTDNGSTWTGVGKNVFLFRGQMSVAGANDSVAAQNGAQNNDTSLAAMVKDCGADAGEGLSGIVSIFGPGRSADDNMTGGTFRFSSYHQGNYTDDYHGSWYGATTTGVNAIRLAYSSGNIESGIFQLYGVN